MIPVEKATDRIILSDTDQKDIVYWLAVQIAKVLSPGALAELRRLSVQNPFSPTVWRLLTDSRFDMILAGNTKQVAKAEFQWSLIIHMLALTPGQHNPTQPLGKALASNGFSEIRLNRLLKSQDDQLLDQIEKTARFLKSKGVDFDAYELAALILAQPKTTRGDAVRNWIARSYYINLAIIERE